MDTKKKYANWALIAIAMLLFGTAIATVQYKVPVVMGDIMTKMDMDAVSGLMAHRFFHLHVGIICPAHGRARQEVR